MGSDRSHETEECDAAKEIGDTVSEMDRARRKRLLVLTVGLVLVVGVAAGVWALVSPDPSLLLPEAAGLIDGAADLDAGSERTDRAAKAERLLRRYLERIDQAAAQTPLLLACALVLQQADLASTPPKTDMEIELLFDCVDPRSCDTKRLIRSATIFLEGGRLREAAACAQAALQREGHREEALRVASEVCFAQGDYSLALDLCREWSELASNDPRPLEIVAAIHEERAETDQLIKVDQRLLEMKPDKASEIRQRLVNNLIATGEAAAARQQYDLLRDESPQDVRQEVAEAGLLYLEGDFELASERVRQILTADAENCLALKIGGKIQLEQLRIPQAIETFRRLVELNPDDYEGHYLLGQAYAQSGDIQQARRHLRLHREILGF